MRRPGEDPGVVCRANAVLLLDDGKICSVIAEFLCLDDDTVRTWHKHCQFGGRNDLEMFDWKGGMPYMSTTQEAELCLWLEESLCRDSKEIRAHGGRFRGSICAFRLHQTAASSGF